MEPLEIIVAIVAGIISNYLFIYIKDISSIYYFKRKYMFLKPYFKDEKMNIIISHHGTTKGDLYESENTILVRIEEVLATFFITEFFKKKLNNKTKIDIRTSNISIEELKNESFISLGSTINNELLGKLENLLSKKGIPLHFNKNTLNITVNNEIFKPVVNSEKKVIKDYGILIKTPNPYSSEYNSLFCLGITGFSTKGIIEFITNEEKCKDFEKLNKNIVKEETICILFEFEIDNDLVSDSKVKYVYSSKRF